MTVELKIATTSANQLAGRHNRVCSFSEYQNFKVILTHTDNVSMKHIKVLLVLILTIAISAGQEGIPEENLVIFSTVEKVPGQAPTNGPVTPIATTTGQHSYINCGENKRCVRGYVCPNGQYTKYGRGITDNRIDVCPGVETCCHIGLIDTDKLNVNVSSVPLQEGCGYRNIDGVGSKVDQPDQAEFGEFPWMVAILREEGNHLIYHCGGSLVTPELVITAAHCVRTRPMDKFVVRAGDWELDGSLETLRHYDSKINQIIINENFKKVRNFNDIALLMLKDAFNFTSNINTVCLPPPRMNFDGTTSGCLVSGWGQDTAGVYQMILKKIELPIVSHEKCEEDLRKTHLGQSFSLHSSFVCAGGEKNKDTCKGDGGSPLICPIPGSMNRYYQVGIVSWGIGCGVENPGVYISVPILREWIDQYVRSLGLNSSYFTP